MRFLLKQFDLGDEGFILEPQGMVRVISAECIRMPNNVIGYALVKNALSNNCVLAINTGIVDPGYKGPISSTLINFGKEPFVITNETQFLRLTFHTCRDGTPARQFPEVDHDKYLDDAKAQVRAASSHTFLNLHQTANRAADLAFKSFKRWALVVITIASLLFAAVAVFAPIGGALLEKWATSSWEHDMERRLEERHADQTRRLETRIVQLEKNTKGK